MANTVLVHTKKILKETFKDLKENEPIIYCAAIAFFTIFSLPAILIVVVLIASLFFTRDEVRSEIVSMVNENINPEAGNQVEEVMEHGMDLPGNFWWILVGILVIIKSATMIFFIMQKALNSVWRIRVKKKVNFLKLMKHRAITLAIVAGLGFFLVIFLMADTMINIFGDQMSFLREGITQPMVRIGGIIFSILMEFIFFTTIHKILPDAKIAWKDALFGGAITTILFTIGKEVISLILNNLEVEGYYATTGSLVILLLWVFYSSIILFLGAELTRSYSIIQGRETIPSSIAIKFSRTTKKEGSYN